MMKKYFYISFSLIFFITGCSLKKHPDQYSRTETLMNTFVQVKIPLDGSSYGNVSGVADKAFESANLLEDVLSAFNPESEVNILNIVKTKIVSPELFNVLKISAGVSERTEGEFDITVAPVLKKDGFYSSMPAGLLSLIPDSTSGVGWKNVVMIENRKVFLMDRNTWVDLSGIAKGYIVDHMAGILRNEGIKRFLINAGGDIYCETASGGTPWYIGIRKPASENIVSTLKLTGQAVATSGDYENVIFDKKTKEDISHIIDPETLTARPEIPSSITVIAPTCAEADAMATGMMAMGAERAIKLADKIDGVEAIGIDILDGKEKIYTSKGVSRYIVEEKN